MSISHLLKDKTKVTTRPVRRDRSASAPVRQCEVTLDAGQKQQKNADSRQSERSWPPTAVRLLKPSGLRAIIDSCDDHSTSHGRPMRYRSYDTNRRADVESAKKSCPRASLILQTRAAGQASRLRAVRPLSSAPLEVPLAKGDRHPRGESLLPFCNSLVILKWRRFGWNGIQLWRGSRR